jgi:ABC-type transport system involved in multi-copper enzyme maturation permease subunit
MNARAVSLAVRWLVADTFRQARADGALALALAVAAACALGCLTVAVEPLPAGEGHAVEALFGLVRLEVPGGRDRAVAAAGRQLAGLVADTAGVWLLLLWTAGLLPGFLDPAQAAVLLAKPVPRWSLLLGKCLGVLAFAAACALGFVAATWLALSARTGVWDARYLLALPLLLLHFLVFFSFSAMLAAVTRSTVACLFGTMLFWLLCWATNFARQAARSSAELEGMAGRLGGSVEWAYWLLPKPLDFQLILGGLLESPPLPGLIDLPLLAGRGLWHPGLSVLASLVAAAGLFALAAYEFLAAEY